MTRRPLLLAAASALALAVSAVPTTAFAHEGMHPYRHGLVPTVEQAAKNALGLPIIGLNFQLSYGGGNSGVGVTPAGVLQGPRHEQRGLVACDGAVLRGRVQWGQDVPGNRAARRLSDRRGTRRRVGRQQRTAAEPG